MARYVAFLRAINVGGRTVRMQALRAHFAALGFTRVETFIASGNVIFEARAAPDGRLAARIEAHLAKALGFEVATFVRTAGEVAALAKASPFAPREVFVGGAHCVGFLAQPLAAPARERLASLASDVDDLRPVGREVWWLSRVRQSESRFSSAALEKALGVPCTFRGLNTLARLADHLAKAGG